jgi:hypothetical protein
MAIKQPRVFVVDDEDAIYGFPSLEKYAACLYVNFSTLAIFEKGYDMFLAKLLISRGTLPKVAVSANRSVQEKRDGRSKFESFPLVAFAVELRLARLSVDPGRTSPSRHTVRRRNIPAIRVLPDPGFSIHNHPNV